MLRASAQRPATASARMTREYQVTHAITGSQHNPNDPQLQGLNAERSTRFHKNTSAQARRVESAARQPHAHTDTEAQVLNADAIAKAKSGTLTNRKRTIRHKSNARRREDYSNDITRRSKSQIPIKDATLANVADEDTDNSGYELDTFDAFDDWINQTDHEGGEHQSDNDTGLSDASSNDFRVYRKNIPRLNFSGEINQRLLRLRRTIKYRAYQSFHPCANKLLQMKVDKGIMERHDKKLNQAAPRINTAPPRRYVISRAKQLKGRQDKLAQIEASNRVLLKRIVYQQKVRRPLGLVKGEEILKKPVEGRGINGPYKREIEQQIVEENKALLARLESQRAHYARMRWEKERCENLFYLANIANHPITFIEEIEELGMHKSATQQKSPGDPYRPATAPTEMQKLMDIKSKILQEIEHEEHQMQIYGRWRPVGPLLPQVATRSVRKSTPMDNQNGKNGQSTTKGKIGSKKYIGEPFIPRVALLAMAKTRKPVVEHKEPISVVKQWSRVKVVQVEHKALFDRLKKAKRLARPIHRRISPEAEREINLRQANILSNVQSLPEIMNEQDTDFPEKSPVEEFQQSKSILSEGSLLGLAVNSNNTTKQQIQNGLFNQNTSFPSDTHIAAVKDTLQQIEHTIEAVITGVPGLSASYPIPDPVSKTVWLFFSSTTDDTVNERDVFVEKCVPDLQSLCRSRGLDFRCVEILGGNVHESLVNTHQISKIYMQELERCIKESTAVNFITVLGDQYGSRVLPFTIPSATFNLITKELKAIGSECLGGPNMLMRWYKLDENTMPPARVLQPITSEFPNFINDSEPTKKADAKVNWENQVLWPLQHDLKMAALALGEQGKLSNETVQQFAQSLTHEEIIRGVFNQRVDPSTNRVLGKAIVVFRNKKAKETLQDELDTNAIFMKSLKNVTKDWVPKQNLIVENLPESNDPNVDTSNHTIYIHRIMQKVLDAASASIIYHADLIQNVDPPNTLVEEILHHIRFLRSRSREFVRREHIVERVTNYMSQTKINRILPLIICGSPGTGKTGVMCKSLQKVTGDLFMNEKRMQEIAKKLARESEIAGHSGLYSHHSGLKPNGRPMAPISATGMRRLSNSALPPRALTATGTRPESHETRRMSIMHGSQIQLSAINQGQPTQPIQLNGDPRQVVVFRCVGISHMSSTPISLMLSLAAQISQAYGVPASNLQYEDPTVKFKRALKLPHRDRPLLLVLAKLDRLVFHSEAERSMGWLLDEIPPFINLVISTRDERSRGTILSQTLAKINLLAPIVQNELRDQKGAIDTSKWTLPVLADQSVLSIGDFIPTVAKVALRRYLGIDSRKLRPEQEEVVMQAFERANMLDLQRVGTASPTLLRLLYNITRAWRSYDKTPPALPISISKTIEHVFSAIESQYGAGVVATVCSVISTSRDGLSPTEIEDMLSIEDSILHRTILWSNARVTRISPVYFLQLMGALSESGLLMSRLDPNGNILYHWDTHEFAECIRAMYLSNPEKRIRAASLLCDYFLGRYHVKKPFTGEIDPAARGGDNRPALTEYRGVPEQPTKLTEAALIFGRWAERRAAWNIRKIRELPMALVRANRWKELLEAIYDIEIIEGMRETSGIFPTIAEITKIIKHGEAENMPFACLEPIREVLEFLRERAEQIVRMPSHLLPGYMYDQLLRVPEGRQLAKLSKPMRSLRPDNAWQHYGRIQCVRGFLPVMKQGYRDPAPIAEASIINDTNLAKPTFSPITFYDVPASYGSLAKSLVPTSSVVFLDFPDEKLPESIPRWMPYRMRQSYVTHFPNLDHIMTTRDGGLLIAATKDGVVFVRSSDTFHDLHSLAHESTVTAMAISNDRSFLITASGQIGDYRLTVWSLADGNVVKRIRGRTIGITSIITGCGFTITRNEDALISNHRGYAHDNSGNLKIFTLEVTRVFSTLFCEKGNVVSRSSPDGRFVVIGGRNVAMYNVVQSSDVWEQKAFGSDLKLRYHTVRQLRFTADGSSFFSLSTVDIDAAIQAKADVDWRSYILIWNTTQGGSSVALCIEDYISCFSLTGDSRFLCTGGVRNVVRVWNTNSNTCVMEQHVSEGITGCFIAQESLGATAELPTKAAAAAKSSRKESSSSKKNDRIHKELQSKPEAASPSSSLHVSQRASRARHGGGDTGSKAGVEQHATFSESGEPQSIESNVSMVVMASTKDGFVRLWKTVPVLEMDGQNSHINSLCITPDGDYLIANMTRQLNRYEYKTTMAIYDAHTGQRLAVFPNADPAIWLQVAPPVALGLDMIIFSGTASGHVKMWAWPPALSPESETKSEKEAGDPDPNVQKNGQVQSAGLGPTVGHQDAAKIRVPGRVPSTTLMREFCAITTDNASLSAISYSLQPTLGFLAMVTHSKSADLSEAKEAVAVSIWNVFTGEMVQETRHKVGSLEQSHGSFTPMRPLHISWSRTDATIFCRLPPPDIHDVPNPALCVFGGEKIFIAPRLGISRSSSFSSLLAQKSLSKICTASAQCYRSPAYSVFAFGDHIMVIRETPDDLSPASCVRQLWCSFRETIIALAMIDDGTLQIVLAMTSAGTVCMYDLNHTDKAGGATVGEVACWVAGAPLSSMCVSEGPSARDQCWRVCVWGPGGLAAVLRLRL